ncbi:hypothetical protein MHM582_2556 [Microbacterium sp. HM58-2]|nr:hypothetical protein MHM582_2556 [Microbacterium sp. HM58-2]
MSSNSGRDPERKREAYRRWRRENPEKVVEYRRRYVQEHAEHIAALNRAWREANLDRSRELNRLSARRQAKRRRQREARNARARERYPEIRDAAIERARRFREEHPERVREYQRRYKERHPARARQNAAAASQRYRDAHADELRERQRVAAAERRRADPDAFKEWYARNREAQRARGRESARLRARLKVLGLPARHIQGIYAAERRANDAASDEFFQRRRSLDERAKIATESSNPGALEIPGAVDKRRRQISRVNVTVTAKERIRRATVSGEHRLRTAEVAAELKQEKARERRTSDLERIKHGHEAARQKILDSRPEIYEYHRRRREAQIREEVRMDSVARQYRGLPAYQVGRETAERMDAEVAGIVRARLEALKERTLSKVDRVLERYEPVATRQTASSREAARL